MEVTAPDFRAGESSDLRWAQGVLNQIRVCSIKMFFEAGVQQLTLEALEAGVVLEQIWIHSPQVHVEQSYLGPRESYRV